MDVRQALGENQASLETTRPKMTSEAFCSLISSKIWLEQGVQVRAVRWMVSGSLLSLFFPGDSAGNRIALH
jgi:hypothetical protein